MHAYPAKRTVNNTLNSIARLPFTRIVALVCVAVGIGLVMSNDNYDWPGLTLVAGGLGVIAFFAIPRLARFKTQSYILVTALLAKFVFAMIRNWFAFGVYGGTADASHYNHQGQIVAQYIWKMDFASLAPYLHWGTNFIELFTGVIYTITGPSIYSGYLIYAFLAFLGSYCFYRAFQEAFPGGNHRLFLILIFFFPSLLYWPNGIGKDALISLFIGLFAYGTARLFRNHLRGMLPCILGLTGTLFVRPQIAILMVLAIGLAVIIRWGGRRSVRPVTYIFSIMAVGLFIWFLLPQIATYIRVEELSPQGFISSFMRQQNYSFQGGSSYQIIDITNPLTIPIDLVSLTFRPFPWEAHNLQALAQALEGMLLIGLFVWRIKNLWRAAVDSMSDVYLRFVLFSIVGLLLGFTSIANYGILVRERAMMLPFLFMLMAYNRPSEVAVSNKKFTARMTI